MCISSRGHRVTGLISASSLLTQSDAVNLGSLGVRQVPVYLLYDLLLHLRDGVTAQHLDGCHIWTLTLNQHLQGLTGKHTDIYTSLLSQRQHVYHHGVLRIKSMQTNVHICSQLGCYHYGNWAFQHTYTHAALTPDMTFVTLAG